MKKKPTGGPAFPSLNAEMTGIDSDGTERFDVEPSGGMTLRDYFAANAPIDIALAKEIFHRRNGRDAGWREAIEELANLSGVYADAMIAERAK